MMNSSEFIFDDSDNGNLYNEEYLKSNNVVDMFPEIRELIENEGYALASEMLNSKYLEHIASYGNDYALSGLINVVSNVVVMGNEHKFPYMRGGNSRTLCIPHRIAHMMDSVQDVMYFVLLERCKLISERIGHMQLAHISSHNVEAHIRLFELASKCWGSAISRCYTTSVIPEKLFANSEDPQHLLLHGLHVESVVEAMRNLGKLNVARVYSELYSMHGQEPYHINLGRLPPTTENQVSFESVLEAFILDFLENTENDQENKNDDKQSENGDSTDNSKDGTSSNDNSTNTPTSFSLEDIKSGELMEVDLKKLESNVKEISEEIENNDNFKVEAIVLPDFDADSKLDDYLKFVVSSDPNLKVPMTNRFKNSILRSSLDALNHTNILESMRSQTSQYTLSAIPSASLTFDDYSMIAQGHVPSMFQVPVDSTAQPRSKYAVTIDVSVSMYEWIPYVKSMLRVLYPYIDQEAIFTFSEVSLKMNTKAPVVMTTGGTSIKTALADVKQRGFSKAVLVSDLEDFKNPDMHFDHLIVVATFENRESSWYKKLVSSGKPDHLDSCLKNITGNVEIHCVFLSDLIER